MSGIDTSRGIDSVASTIAALEAHGTQVVTTNTGAQVTGLEAAAYEFGSILASYPADAPPLTRNAAVFQVRDADGNTSMVSLSDLADDIQRQTGFDPLVEFSSNLGATNQGYSIADINYILNQLEGQYSSMTFTQLAQVEGNQALNVSNNVGPQVQQALNLLESGLANSQSSINNILATSPGGVGLDQLAILDSASPANQANINAIPHLSEFEALIASDQTAVANAQAALAAAQAGYSPADQAAIDNALGKLNNATWPNQASELANIKTYQDQVDAITLQLNNATSGIANCPPAWFLSNLDKRINDAANIGASNFPINSQTLATLGFHSDSYNTYQATNDEVLGYLKTLFPIVGLNTFLPVAQMQAKQSQIETITTASSSLATAQSNLDASKGAYSTDLILNTGKASTLFQNWQAALGTAAGNQTSAIHAAQAALDLVNKKLIDDQSLSMGALLANAMTSTKPGASAIAANIKKINSDIATQLAAITGWKGDLLNAKNNISLATTLKNNLSNALVALSLNTGSAQAQANELDAKHALETFLGVTYDSAASAMNACDTYISAQTTIQTNLNGQINSASSTLQDKQTQLTSLQTQLLSLADSSINQLFDHIKTATGVDLRQALAPVIGNSPTISALQLNQIYAYLNQHLTPGTPPLQLMSDATLLAAARQQVTSLLTSASFAQTLANNPNGIDINAEVFALPGSETLISFAAAMDSISNGTGVNISQAIKTILGDAPLTEKNIGLIKAYFSPQMSASITDTSGVATTITGTKAAEYNLANQLNNVDIAALAVAGSPIDADAAIFISAQGSGNISFNQILQQFSDHGYTFSNLLPAGSNSFTLSDLGAVINKLNQDLSPSFRVPSDAVFQSCLAKVNAYAGSSSSTAQTNAIQLLTAMGITNPQQVFTQAVASRQSSNNFASSSTLARVGLASAAISPINVQPRVNTFNLTQPVADAEFTANLASNYSVSDVRSGQALAVSNAGANSIAAALDDFTVSSKVQSVLRDLGTLIAQQTNGHDLDANGNLSITSAVFSNPAVAQALGQPATTLVSLSQVIDYESQTTGFNLNEVIPNLADANGNINFNTLSSFVALINQAVPNLNLPDLRSAILSNPLNATQLAAVESNASILEDGIANARSQISNANIGLASINPLLAALGQSAQAGATPNLAALIQSILGDNTGSSAQMATIGCVSNSGAATPASYAQGLAGLLGISQPQPQSASPQVATLLSAITAPLVSWGDINEGDAVSNLSTLVSAISIAPAYAPWSVVGFTPGSYPSGSLQYSTSSLAGILGVVSQPGPAGADGRYTQAQADANYQLVTQRLAQIVPAFTPPAHPSDWTAATYTSLKTALQAEQTTPEYTATQLSALYQQVTQKLAIIAPTFQAPADPKSWTAATFASLNSILQARQNTLQSTVTQQTATLSQLNSQLYADLPYLPPDQQLSVMQNQFASLQAQATPFNNYGVSLLSALSQPLNNVWNNPGTAWNFPSEIAYVAGHVGVCGFESGGGLRSTALYSQSLGGLLGIPRPQPAGPNNTYTQDQLTAQYAQISQTLAQVAPNFTIPADPSGWTAATLTLLQTALQAQQQVVASINRQITTMTSQLQTLQAAADLPQIGDLIDAISQGANGNNESPNLAQMISSSAGGNFSPNDMSDMASSGMFVGMATTGSSAQAVYSASLAGLLGIPMPQATGPNGRFSQNDINANYQLVTQKLAQFAPAFTPPATPQGWTAATLTSLKSALHARTTIISSNYDQLKRQLQPNQGITFDNAPSALTNIVAIKTNLQNIQFEDVNVAVQSGQASAAVAASATQAANFQTPSVLSAAEIDSQLETGDLYVNTRGQFFLNRQPTNARDASVAAMVISGNKQNAKLNDLMNKVNLNNTKILMANDLSAATSIADLKSRIAAQKAQYGFDDVLKEITGGALSDGSITDATDISSTGTFQSTLKTAINNATKNQDLDTQSLQQLTSQIQANNTAMTQLIQAFEQMLKGLTQNLR